MDSPAPPALVLVQYPGLGPGTTLSPPCGKVHMALRFKGLEYRVQNIRLPSEVRRYNPRGRVPVLLADGKAVVDSTDILTELDARFRAPALEPDSPQLRARGRILEDWADEVLYFYGVWLRWCDPQGFARMRARVLDGYPAPLRWILPAVARRIARRRAAGQGVGLKDAATVRRELQECLASLEALLEADAFLAGDALSRADLAVCAVLDQLCLKAITPETAREIEALPLIAAWRARVHERAPGAAEPE